MPTYSTRKHIVEMSGGLGSVWIVRVFRKRPLVRKLISSDWFLDAGQAQRFVDALMPGLDGDAATTLLTNRKPGWILRRPAH